MYYCLGFFPQFGPELAEAIAAIRKDYDPTAHFFPPHITIIFPTPDSVDGQSLISHIEQVLSGWNPFEIRFGGFYKSRDHWLFLALQEGEAEMKRLYPAFHTDILADGRDLGRFVPHLGLGLFLKEGCMYDWRNPRESDFDRRRYEEALRRAETLPLSASIAIEKLRLTTISDAVIEWTIGRRAVIPEDSKEITVREFGLGQRGV